MTSLQFRRGVSSAARYVPDWEGLDRTTYIRLDRNEATRPVPAAVIDALERHLKDYGIHSYPDIEFLAPAIAGYCGVADGCVLPTNGSDQAIDLCLRSFLDPGATVLMARPEFAIFGHTAELLEASIRGVPYGPDLEFPYAQFRAELAQRPDLIVLINPNNPTGTPVELSFIEEVLGTWPDVPVVVDEAYYEFTGVTAVPLLRAHPNLLVTRTFSKAFAMAGLRLGYVVAGPEIIRELAKVRNPFDVNVLAAVAGRAQLEHAAEMRAYASELMTVVKPMTVGFFRDHDVPVWPGAANFVLIRPDDLDGTIATLRDAGVLVRRMGAPALAGMLRMGIGTEAEMTYVLDVYRQLLSARETTEVSSERA